MRIRRDWRLTTPVSMRSSSSWIQYVVRSQDATPYTPPATTRATTARAPGPMPPESSDCQEPPSTASSTIGARTSGVSGESRRAPVDAAGCSPGGRAGGAAARSRTGSGRSQPRRPGLPELGEPVAQPGGLGGAAARG